MNRVLLKDAASTLACVAVAIGVPQRTHSVSLLVTRRRTHVWGCFLKSQKETNQTHLYGRGGLAV